MKSFVAMTYYQLMHAIAYTVELDEPANLYFSRKYLDVDDEFIDRINKTGVFNEAVGFDMREFETPFYEELKQINAEEEGIIDKVGNSLFEKYLEPFFSKHFCNADTEDEIFVYNDLQLYYYYIAKHFPNIVGIEDGYGSIAQQLRVHRLKGNIELVEPFVGKYFPEYLYKYKNVKRLISSCNFADIPDDYKRKLEVLDFNFLIKNNRDKFNEALQTIFDVSVNEIKNDSIIILGTPLRRSQYCSSVEQYLFYRKTIRNTELKFPQSTIFIKPHPADTMEYELLETDNVKVIDKAFPIEMIQYQGKKVKKTISFGSTAVLDSISRENELIYREKGKPEDVKRFIKDYVKGESISFNIYIKVSRITTDTFINILSYLKTYKHFQINLIVLSNDECYDDLTRELVARNINKHVNTYIKAHNGKANSNFYYQEIKALKGLKNSMPSNVSMNIVRLESLEDASVIKVINNDMFDYCLVADAENLGAYVIRKSTRIIERNSALAYMLLNYTEMAGGGRKRVFLGTGVIDDCYTNDLGNRIISKKMLQSMQNVENINSLADAFHYYDKKIRKENSLYLNVNEKKYSEIGEGKEYYLKGVRKLTEINNSKTISRDRMLGEISLQANEYYNYVMVTNPYISSNAIEIFFDQIDNVGNSEKKDALALLSAMLLTERKRENESFLGQNKIQCYYLKPTIKKLLKSGKKTRMISVAARYNMKQVLRKIVRK